MPCYGGTGRAPRSRLSSPCWPLIWDTLPLCPRTITCTGSSRSERPLVKNSPAITVSWLCPCRTGKEDSDEEETSQPAGRHSARLLHRSPAACSRNEPAHHPQLPRHRCAASALSLRAQQADRGGTRLEGPGPTRNPGVSFLPRERT